MGLKSDVLLGTELIIKSNGSSGEQSLTEISSIPMAFEKFDLEADDRRSPLSRRARDFSGTMRVVHSSLGDPDELPITAQPNTR